MKTVFRGIALLVLLYCASVFAAPGGLYNSFISPGPEIIAMANNGGGAQFTMSAANYAVSMRFVATQNKDITAVKVSWNSVATPGQVSVRIETDSSGKPSGSLYDANAGIDNVVPTAGIQTITFASAPTTNLTVGAVYHLFIITTQAGTTHQLNHAISMPAGWNHYPNAILTATNGTTRTNLAVVNGSTPMASFVLDDSTEDAFGCIPYSSSFTSTNVYGTIEAGMKFTLLSPVNIKAVGVPMVLTGTPAGDPRVRILDSGNSAVTGSTLSLDRTQLTGQSLRGFYFEFPATVTLAAGTYRVVFDSASSANSSNCWAIRSPSFLSSAVVSTSFRLSSRADSGSAWTDSTTGNAAVFLVVDTDTTPAATPVPHFSTFGG